MKCGVLVVASTVLQNSEKVSDMYGSLQMCPFHSTLTSVFFVKKIGGGVSPSVIFLLLIQELNSHCEEKTPANKM